MTFISFCPAIGLFMNFVGTVLLAYSFGKNIAEANQVDDRGNKIYLASFRHPRLFQLGLILLALGFLLQLITLIPWAFGAMC